MQARQRGPSGQDGGGLPKITDLHTRLSRVALRKAGDECARVCFRSFVHAVFVLPLDLAWGLVLYSERSACYSRFSRRHVTRQRLAADGCRRWGSGQVHALCAGLLCSFSSFDCLTAAVWAVDVGFDSSGMPSALECRATLRLASEFCLKTR